MPAGTNLVAFQYPFDSPQVDGATTGYITPLLFEYNPAELYTIYTVVGIGKGYDVALNSAPQAIPFEITEGTKVPTGTNFTFGFVNALVSSSGVPTASSLGTVDMFIGNAATKAGKRSGCWRHRNDKRLGLLGSNRNSGSGYPSRDNVRRLRSGPRLYFALSHLLSASNRRSARAIAICNTSKIQTLPTPARRTPSPLQLLFTLPSRPTDPPHRGGQTLRPQLFGNLDWLVTDWSAAFQRIVHAGIVVGFTGAQPGYAGAQEAGRRAVEGTPEASGAILVAIR